MHSLDRFEVLRMAYDHAFEKLSQEVAVLKSKDGSGKPEAVENLRRRVEAAEVAYRQTRDQLAEFLIDQHGGEEAGDENHKSFALQGCP
jgi:hypothetical protein